MLPPQVFSNGTADVEWPDQDKLAPRRPAGFQHLRVFPLDPAVVHPRPTEVDQLVIVLLGSYAGRRGRVVKFTGPQCTVAFSSDHAHETRSILLSSLATLPSGDMAVVEAGTPVCVPGGCAKPAPSGLNSEFKAERLSMFSLHEYKSWMKEYTGTQLLRL
jgi:hypothetical protein